MTNLIAAIAFVAIGLCLFGLVGWFVATVPAVALLGMVMSEKMYG